MWALKILTALTDMKVLTDMKIGLPIHRKPAEKKILVKEKVLNHGISSNLITESQNLF